MVFEQATATVGVHERLAPSPKRAQSQARVSSAHPMAPSTMQQRDATTHQTQDQYALIDTPAAFVDLEGEWNQLFERAGAGIQVFQTFQWCAAWVRHYFDAKNPGRASLAIVTIRNGGALVGVLPFVVTRAHGIATLHCLGDPVSQYGDVVIMDGPSRNDRLRAAWTYLVAHTGVDVVDLRKVREDAQLRPLLAELGMQRTGGERAPYCLLKNFATYDLLEQRISPKLRKNWRRQHRRLEERGPMAYEVPSGQRAAEDAKLALVMKQAWLVEKGRLSRAFKDDRIHAFFADTAHRGSATSGVELDVLRTAGEMAAASISVTAKKHRALHVIVYGMKFEKAGAGSVNLARTIKRAHDEGIEVFDFLAPASDYKLDWADGSVAVDDFVLPLTTRGKLYAGLWLHGARKLVKVAVARLPKGSGRLLGWIQTRSTKRPSAEGGA